MKRSYLYCVAAALTLMVAGCAVQHVPATFSAMPAAGVSAPSTLADAMTVTFDTGYARTLKAGSRWLAVGTLAQGTVYKPVGDVFTLEGSHVHEAWLVCNDGRLVGFYLPAERGFSPLKTPVALPFTQ